jgi:hypothetical protein
LFPRGEDPLFAIHSSKHLRLFTPGGEQRGEHST